MVSSYFAYLNAPRRVNLRNSQSPDVCEHNLAYGQKVGQSLKILAYAIAVVFTNVRELSYESKVAGINRFDYSMKRTLCSLTKNSKPSDF